VIDRLRKDLPNFPDEVLSDWLLPFVPNAGWPPAKSFEDRPMGRWADLLMGKPLTYWRGIQWSKVDRHVSAQQLDQPSIERVVNLALAAVRGDVNPWSVGIPNLKQRFDSVVEYILVHGSIPRSPTLVNTPLGLSIIDGNHRMAAYLYCYGYFKLDVPPGLQLKTNEIQTFWLGEPNLSFNSDPTVGC
jgi:hypothetical protein